ncbi:winged helix DNA-binding protein [Kineococcus sp. R8]|nr:MarR family winged helix-turn-helix transcriptional regulator [Kineococcus siccus]NAZ82269.1 winged helix DNA-binding protein [Kineococcus siccus]
MWDYVVLSGLENGAAPTQNQLALEVGRDKTRLIATLDRLQERGLVDRQPARHDRRNRVVALTDVGRSVLAECRADVRVMEQELLAPLGRQRRADLLRALDQAVVFTHGTS